MITAIKKYNQNNEKDVEKNAKLFEQKKHKIINNFIANYALFDANTDEDKSFDGIVILEYLGGGFFKTFQKLIRPLNGKAIVPIREYINDIVSNSIAMPLDSFF